MSLLVLIATILVSGFNIPLFKEHIKSAQIETCANGSCVQH
jgi:hypothetical protein